MISSSLHEFIAFASNYLTAHSTPQSDREELLGRVAKLNEEVGELCGSVLARLGDQRKEKLESYNESELGFEIADVIICALLISKLLDLDIDLALKEKTAKIRGRFAEEVS